MSFESPPENIKMVKKALQPHGMVLRHSDGEYRVNFKGGPEATAYYTNDLVDAFRTGLHMATEPRPVKKQTHTKRKRSYGRR